MYRRRKMAKTIILAGIPFLAFPLLAESGMSGDHSQRSQRDDGRRSQSNEQIIQGEISKKNGEEITLRTSEGERITFRINDQTNQLCPKGTQTSQTPSMSKGSTGNQDSAMDQGNSSGKTSGQSTSGQNQMAQGSSAKDSSPSGQTSSNSLFGIGSGQTSGESSSGQSSSGQSSSGMQSDPQQSQQQGFKFGECNFQKGEFVKAKLDENKIATFVRSMGDSEEYFGTGGVSGEYFVLPAGQLGGLDISDKDANYSVKSTDGKEIGNLYRVMTNNNGDISYAIIRKPDGQLISVPWQALEGAGNKSFKMKVTQNQLGNLPILNEGENAGAHVQKHWNLTEQERKNLAKWNESMDDSNQTRDRYYEDTPTFPNNREGYDRYDSNNQRSSGMSRSGDDRQRHYQDQNAEEYQTKRKDFSPTEFPPHDRAFSYEGADQQNSSNRNRQGSSSNDSRNRGNQQYSRSQDRNYDNDGDRSDRRDSRSNRRNYRSPMENLSDRYNTTAPRSDYNSQREGYDQNQSRNSRGSGYDYRPDGYRP